MTARPSTTVAPDGGLRVLKGRRLRRLTIAPWMIVAVIAVVAFLGLGFARTSLDRSAFELAELDRNIGEQVAINRQLNLEIARLENPAVISPLAEELGMVIPPRTIQILVDLDTALPVVAGRSSESANQ